MRNHSIELKSNMFISPQVSPMKYYAKAFANFHQINAFEEDGFLMMDLCCFDDGQALDIYFLQNLRKSGEALDEVSSLLRSHCVHALDTKSGYIGDLSHFDFFFWVVLKEKVFSMEYLFLPST